MAQETLVETAVRELMERLDMIDKDISNLYEQRAETQGELNRARKQLEKVCEQAHARGDAPLPPQPTAAKEPTMNAVPVENMRRY